MEVGRMEGEREGGRKEGGRRRKSSISTSTGLLASFPGPFENLNFSNEPENDASALHPAPSWLQIHWFQAAPGHELTLQDRHAASERGGRKAREREGRGRDGTF